MNQSQMEVLSGPLLQKIQETIQHMSALTGTIPSQSQRMGIQNDLHGLMHRVREIDPSQISSVHPGATLPYSMRLMGKLKGSIQSVSQETQRRQLLEQMGLLTAQFLTAASAINRMNRQPAASPHWGGHLSHTQLRALSGKSFPTRRLGAVYLHLKPM